MAETRVCLDCKEILPIEEFYPRPANRVRKVDARCKACYRAKQNGERGPDHHKRNNLKAKYGMTLEEYDEMLDLQGGGCAICGSTNSLVVDHSHIDGHVRAIICQKCNIALGQADDSIERLRVMIQYLIERGE